MIVGIEGTLINKSSNSITIKTGPLSFLLYVPGSTLARLGNIGSNVSLHTHLYVREDMLALYGFSTWHELNIFEQLITVSGIGPKVALALLTALNTEQIVSAILTGNADLLSQVPGIGKKTAGRIILDLKGKLEKGWEGEVTSSISSMDSDALAALIGLGYSVREATQALSNIPHSEGITVEDKIRLALQRLAR